MNTIIMFISIIASLQTFSFTPIILMDRGE